MPSSPDPYQPPGRVPGEDTASTTDGGVDSTDPNVVVADGKTLTLNYALTPGVVFIIVSVVVLLVLHQDNWNWTDGTLVFGFIPKALAYHATISIAASIVWFLATVVAWPVEEVQQ